MKLATETEVEIMSGKLQDDDIDEAGGEKIGGGAVAPPPPNLFRKVGVVPSKPIALLALL